MTDHHGTLWIVKEDMSSKCDKEEAIGNREVIIKKGEIIEWRYSCDNHFRTLDDKWFYVTDEVWNKHCLRIGKIHSDVCWKNKANTEEIYRLCLFDFTDNGDEILKNIEDEIKREQEGTKWN